MGDTIALPSPCVKGKMSIEEAVAARRSRRGYKSDPLKLADIGQLLWAAQGITGPEQQRTAPSAGALYPLEIYVAATRVDGLPPGLYSYDPESHALALLSPGDKRRDLTEASGWQDCIRFSSCVLLIAGVFSRTTAKYGERGIRYVHMEAGHVAENIFLQATALGLGMVVAASFDDARVASVAHLADGEDPLCLLPLGRI